MGFLDYDVEIRKIICSTNAIESLNAHYRRAVRARLLRHFATALVAKPGSKIVDHGSDLVGDTGIEPVTSSV